MLTEIATAKGKSPAQVILAWHAKRNMIPLVKTSKPERLAENMAYTEVELSEEEMAKIATLEKGARLYNPKFMDQTYDWNYFPYYN